MRIDRINTEQGETEDGRTFGYCGISGRGGQFFTWMDTLQKTLNTIEDDEIDPPVDWPERAYQNVRGIICRAWSETKGRVK
jgi:hypothetical protein